MVVVPQEDEVAELLRAGKGAGLSGNALLEAAVTGNDENMVVENRLAHRGFRVENAVRATRGHRESDGGSDAGTQRAGRDLNALGVAVLGVRRGEGPLRAQGLNVLKLKGLTGEVHLAVLGQRGVAGGEDETVTAQPMRILGVETQVALEQQVGGGGEGDRGAGMAGAHILHCVS